MFFGGTGLTGSNHAGDPAVGTGSGITHRLQHIAHQPGGFFCHYPFILGFILIDFQALGVDDPGNKMGLAVNSSIGKGGISRCHLYRRCPPGQSSQRQGGKAKIIGTGGVHQLQAQGTGKIETLPDTYLVQHLDCVNID